VTIGQNCVIHPNVFIEDACVIGSGVILHSGVVIGADGFGYVKDDSPATPSADSAAAAPPAGGEYIKFPQIGTVVIEDDVEIGANTCVDRGALGETRIGAGTKIDNLVQVGHNVQIGKRCVIAAQTGISGSTVIEDDCVIGGQVGFGDHAHVKSGAIIGSQAGVLPGKIVRPGVWWGTPIQPLDEYKRQNAHVKSLDRLKAEVKELKRKLAGMLDGE
jgi:UDP-3-O-[3-hydroxymyristoyl] glucosamine N-acyltransferase